MTAANIWLLAGSVSKLLMLLAMAGIVGGGFSLYLAQRFEFPEQQALHRYLLVSTVLGVFATLLVFLVQVGGINQNGWRGMLDPMMATILAQSNTGYTAGLRLLGFFSVLPALYLFRRYLAGVGHRQPQRSMAYCILAVVAILLGLSFALIGHTSTLPPAARGAILLHVLAVFLWTGSLYPLLRLSAVSDIARIQQLMKGFGTIAMGIVAVLVVSGIFLLTQLLQTFTDLWTTVYGLTILLKLAGVSGLLALAGINRLLLVPDLLKTGSARALQSSIRLELLMALFVLTATAWLTTGMGPAN